MDENKKEHILSLSYGKDSLAMLGAIEKLNLPLDRIITIEVWATDTISADLPPMVEFKAKVDKIIKERWGFDVEHVRAKNTYEEGFYKVRKSGERVGQINGFPFLHGAWCNGMLKKAALRKIPKDAIQYLGITADELNRIKQHGKKSNVELPLVEIGWKEVDCKKWCEENDLLSPIYQTSTRGGVGSVIIKASVN